MNKEYPKINAFRGDQLFAKETPQGTFVFIRQEPELGEICYVVDTDSFETYTEYHWRDLVGEEIGYSRRILNPIGVYSPKSEFKIDGEREFLPGRYDFYLDIDYIPEGYYLHPGSGKY